MPCMKCDSGKWKWGHRGECRYDTEKECKDAHKGSPHVQDEQHARNLKRLENLEK